MNLRAYLLDLHAYYWARLDDENADRQLLLEELLDRLYILGCGVSPSTIDTLAGGAR